jgi:hypothetical protein
MSNKQLAKIIQDAYCHASHVDVLHDGSTVFGHAADRELVVWECEALQPDQKPPTRAYILQVLNERDWLTNRPLDADEIQHWRDSEV